MVRPLFDTNVLIDCPGGVALARDELARYPDNTRDFDSTSPSVREPYSR